VSDAIRRGQLRWNRTDGWRFALVEGGIRFVVVVGDTETNSPVVVTGWTEVADREAALDARPDGDGVDVDGVPPAGGAQRVVLDAHPGPHSAADRDPTVRGRRPPPENRAGRSVRPLRRLRLPVPLEGRDHLPRLSRPLGPVTDAP